jgi:Na+/proline symporter
MADLQAAGEIITWTVRGITILLMIIASSIAIKKNNNIALIIVIMGNLVAFYFTRSPLVCWIISIVGIIGISSMNSPGQNKQGTQKKGVKAGNIIGIIIGIGLVAAPLIGYLRQEASLKDPTNQALGILFAVIGGFMIINNIFKLIGGEDSSLLPPVKAPPVEAPYEPGIEAENIKDKVRCRFCDKLYSAEYNGCPYCKMK